MKSSPTTSLRHHLWFDRCDSRFAIPMEHLREVLPAPRLRPLPGAAPALVGLMQLREYVLPVFDPWSMATPEPGSPPRQAAVIVVDLAGKPVLGLVAEFVGKVIELPSTVAMATPPQLPAAFSGESRPPGQEPVLVLDVPGLVAAFDLAAPDGSSQN